MCKLTIRTPPWKRASPPMRASTASRSCVIELADSEPGMKSFNRVELHDQGITRTNLKEKNLELKLLNSNKMMII